jgi:hypothetical protein
VAGFITSHSSRTNNSWLFAPSSLILANYYLPLNGALYAKANMKHVLDFNSLDELEKSMYLDDTWCDNCSKADLGIDKPELYVENNRKFISGSCKVCGESCSSEIITHSIN